MCNWRQPGARRQGAKCRAAQVRRPQVAAGSAARGGRAGARTSHSSALSGETEPEGMMFMAARGDTPSIDLRILGPTIPAWNILRHSAPGTHNSTAPYARPINVRRKMRPAGALPPRIPRPVCAAATPPQHNTYRALRHPHHAMQTLRAQGWANRAAQMGHAATLWAAVPATLGGTYPGGAYPRARWMSSRRGRRGGQGGGTPG